jgi:hypothetical protein
VLKPWYADSAAMIGPPVDGIPHQAMQLLEECGPACGYYPELSKSIFVPFSPEARDECQWRLAEFQFEFQDGSCYVAGFISTDDVKREWLEPQIKEWDTEIETLSCITKQYSQTAYAGLVKSLQIEWMYLQCILPGIEDIMAPLEEAIQKIFLPALFEQPEASLTGLRPLMCLGVGKADLGVPDPRDTVKANLLALQSITIFLVDSLTTRTPLNTVAYLEGGSQL